MASFFRVLSSEDKAAVLARVVDAFRSGDSVNTSEVLYSVDTSSFSHIPGSPFSYWVSEVLRELFTQLPPFEGEGRTARVGLQTSDDSRFVRAWWEVRPERTVSGTVETTPEGFREQTMEGKRWVPFAKGGSYSPYYADLHLVLNWENDGRELKSFSKSVVRNPEFYFRSGLTWPLRAHSFAPAALPAGGIFSVRGYAILAHLGALPALLGVGNSSAFDFLFKLMLGRFGYPEFIVGVLQHVPFPNMDKETSSNLGQLVERIVKLKRSSDRSNELSHLFCFPMTIQRSVESLSAATEAWCRTIEEATQEVARCQGVVDDLLLRLYGIGTGDAQLISKSRVEQQHGFAESDSAVVDTDEEGGLFGEEEGADSTAPGAVSTAADVLSYALGVVFGRWDVRLATGERPLPELQDPFAPLPVCSPGMLTGPGGLPARPEEVPPGYPVSVQWDGILSDDEGHQSDLVARVREVLAVLFPGRAAAIEDEACRLLGTKDLRSWFRDQFPALHVRKYSKSQRKAPIYCQLRSARKSYSLWLYYPRLTADTLWTAIRTCVEPKLEYEGRMLEELRVKLDRASSNGELKEERALAQRLEEQERLLQELLQFKGDLLAVANRGYDPDLDDGVLLNIAPLHRMVPWKEAEVAWRELEAGKYNWSTIAGRIVRK